MAIGRYLPVKRYHEFLKEIFNVDYLREQSLILLIMMAKKSDKQYFKISLMYSTVIVPDKTGVYTNGENHRYWTF